MSKQTKCPKCKSENIYADGASWICPECSSEWTESEADKNADEPSGQKFATSDWPIKGMVTTYPVKLRESGQ